MKRLTATKRLRTISTGFEHEKHADSSQPTSNVRNDLQQFLKNVLRILFGLAIYSFGVYLTIYANIGLAPWDCLAVGISRHTPLNYGGAMAAVSLAAIVIQLLLHERIGIATVLDAIITGNLTQLFCNISPYPDNHSLWLGIIFMIFGFLFIALGMFVYMSAEYGCGPKDGLLIAIGKRLPKIPIGIVEILLWVVVTLIGWLLGGTVGIGTVISMFGSGMVMHLFYRIIHFDPRALHHRSISEIYGYDTASDTTMRATTVPVTLNIRESGFEGEEPPIPPTPDLYTQLLKRIEDAKHGLDGKSAYEIAVEHGYVGTEEEWLASLKGKDGVTPDMSEYPKTTEVQTIVEQQIAPVAEDAHTHDNKATLDSLTPELFAELYELQQFEDSTIYDIQTVNEEILNLQQYKHRHNNQALLDRITEAMIAAIEEYGPFEDWTREQIHTLFESVNNFSNTAHTHENKDVLDSITEQYMRDLTAFQASTANALYGLSTGLSEVSAQAHSHANKAVLDSITQEMLDDIASISTVVGQAHWHHNLTTLNGITESHVSRWNEAYTATMNLNERVGVNEGVFERFKTEILYDMQGAKTSITDINTRLAAVEGALSGVEDALAAIVEVTA